MGKKGKANKLAKMSDEERARYMQMRADAEEEARRRKMQLIALYLKNKLKREEAFGRLNLAKINQEWRSMLRQTKCEQLRRELLELEEYLRVKLERKDRIISRLLNEFIIAEDTYATLQTSHMQTINHLIAIQQDRMQFLREYYESEKNAALQDYAEHAAHFKQLRDAAEVQVQAVLCQLEDEAAREMRAKHERHLERLDDIKSKMELQLEQITLNGEAKLERLWKEYQDILSGYVKHTEGFYADYVDLKERDEENTAAIREHCRQIELASDQLAHLRLSAQDTDEQNQAKIRYLSRVKEELSTRFHHFKAKADALMKTQEQRFNFMCVQSHNALKKLKDQAAKGDVLLQLSAVCAKLMTEKERILPLGLPTLPKTALGGDERELEDEPENESKCVTTPKSEQVEAQDSIEISEPTLQNWKFLENFWKRVNSVSVDVATLVRNKKMLQAENERLKAEVQEHLIELNIGSGSNAHVNDYLARRPNSMRVDRVTRMTMEPKQQRSAEVAGPGRRPITAACQEANLSNAVRSVRLMRARPKLARIEAFVHS